MIIKIQFYEDAEDKLDADADTGYSRFVKYCSSVEMAEEFLGVIERYQDAIANAIRTSDNF